MVRENIHYKFLPLVKEKYVTSIAIMRWISQENLHCSLRFIDEIVLSNLRQPIICNSKCTFVLLALEYFPVNTLGSHHSI